MNEYIANRDKLIEKLGADANQYDKVNMMVAGYVSFHFVFCFVFKDQIC